MSERIGGARVGVARRTTSECDVTVKLDLDGEGRATVASGLPFLDHLLAALARHGRLDLELSCRGDLEVDDHHTVEECALAIGQALDRALGDRRAIARFGDALAPLDESLARVALDLSGRGGAWLDLGLRRERLGTLACENVAHFLRSFAAAGRLTLHVDLLRGENDHHRAEAAFKAVARALRAAVARDGDAIPSTKGTLS